MRKEAKVSDYEKSQRRRNVTVGIFVVLALGALAYLIMRFNDLPGFVTEHSSYQVYVRFPSAPGVQVDTPVRFCGYQIGRVTDIMPPTPLLNKETNQTYHQTVCILSINNKYKNIPSNVKFKVATKGLGSSSIELNERPGLGLVPLDPNDPNTVYLRDKMTLQGLQPGGATDFIPESIMTKFQELMDGLTLLVDNANEIIGDDSNKENIKATLGSLAKASEKAAEDLELVKGFIESGTNTSEEIGMAIKELRLIAEKINSGEGTAGKLVNDGQLYESLLANTEQLEILIKDVKNFVNEYRAKGIKVSL